MLKILYIVGTGSKNCDWELRWSLRSVEKFAQCDVQPVIVGNVPEWFKGDALPCGDKFERKEKNINRKIMKAIEAKLVEGEFQISADDHFWLKPIDFGVMPVYYREGLLPNAEKDGNNYAKALVGTRVTLHKLGYPVWNTACHRNAWAKADTINEVQRLIDFANRNQNLAGIYGMVAWALWPNVLLNHDCDEGSEIHVLEKTNDLKYRGEPDFKAFVDGSEVFSVNDSAFGSNDFIQFMQKNYGKKSRWER